MNQHFFVAFPIEARLLWPGKWCGMTQLYGEREGYLKTVQAEYCDKHLEFSLPPLVVT